MSSLHNCYFIADVSQQRPKLEPCVAILLDKIIITQVPFV